MNSEARFMTRTDMPMIQTRVSRKEALKFVDRMKSVGWTPVFDTGYRDVHFLNKADEVTIDYSVTLFRDHGFIGVRPQFPTEA